MDNTSLQDQRRYASGLLPAVPLRENNKQTSELRRFEVVLAYNLQHPYRYCQDYWWLEVLSENERIARVVAAEWVMEQGDIRFECTDWVREATPHIVSTRIGGDTEPLAVNWNVPVDEAWASGTIIRDPINGERIGFIASREQEQAVLANIHPRLRGQYRLIKRRPARSADIVCLLPAVRSANHLPLPD